MTTKHGVKKLGRLGCAVLAAILLGACSDNAPSQPVDSSEVARPTSAVPANPGQGPVAAGPVAALVQVTGVAQFKQVVLQAKTPVLVDFFAEWCGPCKFLAPIFAELAQEQHASMGFAHLDVDPNPTLAAFYKVESYPTLILFRNGREVSRQEGIPQLDAAGVKAYLVQWLKEQNALGKPDK